jgi:hypothetical protein
MIGASDRHSAASHHLRGKDPHPHAERRDTAERRLARGLAPPRPLRIELEHECREQAPTQRVILRQPVSVELLAE